MPFGESSSEEEESEHDLSDLESEDEDGRERPPKKSPRTRFRNAVLAVMSANRWRRAGDAARERAEATRLENEAKAAARTALARRPAERTPEDLAVLDSLTNDIDFFRQQGIEKRLAMARIMGFEAQPAHHVVFRQGDRGEKLYVIVTGEVEVLLAGDDGVALVVATLGEGASFGELALGQDGETRAATIQTSVPTEFVTLTREDFQELFADEQNAVQRKMDYFRGLQFFNSWRLANLKRFSYAFVNQDWGRGRRLTRQGKVCDSVMFLVSGTCIVSRRSALLHHRRSQQIATVGPGFICGQLFPGEPTTYSVLSTSDILVYEISADKFHSMVSGYVLHQLREWVGRLDQQREARAQRAAGAIEEVRQSVYDTMFRGHEPTMDDLLKVAAATAKAKADEEAREQEREWEEQERERLRARAKAKAKVAKSAAEAEESDAAKDGAAAAAARHPAAHRERNVLPEKHPQLYGRTGAISVPASRQLLHHEVHGPTTIPRAVPVFNDADDPDRPPDLLPHPDATTDIVAEPAPTVSNTLHTHMRTAQPGLAVTAMDLAATVSPRKAAPRLHATVQLPLSPSRAPKPTPCKVPLGSSPTMGSLSFDAGLDGDSYVDWGADSEVYASVEQVQEEVDERAVRANEAALIRLTESTPSLAQRVKTDVGGGPPGAPRSRSASALVGVTPIKPTSDELEVFLAQIRANGLSPPRRRHKPVADIHLAGEEYQSHSSLFKTSLSDPRWRERVLVAERRRGAEKSTIAQYLTEARVKQADQQRREAERKRAKLPKPAKRRPGEKPPGMVGNIVSTRNLRKLAEQKAEDEVRHARLRMRVERMQIEIDTAAFY